MEKVVVHIVPKLDFYGGIENIVRLFFYRTNNLTHKLFLITFSNLNENKLVKKAQAEGIQVIALDKALFESVQNKLLRFVLKNIVISQIQKYYSLKKLLSGINPQIIFTHGEDSELISSFLSNSYKIVNVIHGAEYFPRNIFYKYYLFYIARKKFHHTIIVSKILENYIPLGQSYSVIYAGIDFNHFAFCKEDSGIADKKEIHFGFIGRVEVQKGINKIIGAFLKIQNRHSNIFLDILGDGKIKEKLINQLSLKRINSINFYNKIEDPISFYKKIDFLIICSKSEGGPLVALEAMATGVIVISNKIGIIPELISDKFNGILLNDDSEEELVRVLENSIVLRKESFQLILNAFNTVRNYSAERMLLEYNNLINQLT